MNSDDNRIEAEPLLADEERESIEFAESQSPEPDAGRPRAKPARRGFTSRFQATKHSTIITLLALLTFAITTSGMMFMLPMFRLMEDAICHVHYEKELSEPIDEKLCKIDAVQKYLAYLGGWSAMIGSVVGLITALPYGVLADRIGRKPAFTLAYFGIILAFAWGPMLLVAGKAPNLILLIIGSLFFLIGGGVPVAMNSLNAMASDISTESERAAGFLYLSSGAFAGGLLGPIAAGLLMETVGPWVPILIVFAITPFVFVLLLFIPETLPIKLREPTELGAQKSLRENMRDAAKELSVSFALLKNPNITLSLTAFLIQPALFAAYTSTLAQHISKYFGWTLAQTNYLLSPLSILQLCVIFATPKASSFLTNPTGRFRLSVFSKDLFLTKLSLGLLILGAILEGLSKDVVLFLIGLTVGSFGSSGGALCRAVTTAYVEPQQTSRLYGLISMLETGGAFLGGPVLAWCFNTGLSKRGIWTGLPWFYVAGLMSVAFVALMFVRKPKEKAVPLEDSDDEGNGDLGYLSAEEETV